MDWNHLLTSFEGRINRQPFWMATLVLVVINIIASVVITALFGDSTLAQLLQLLVALALLYPSLAVAAKRWHDRDKSGWWNLIVLIPLVGPLWYVIECGFLRGTDGPNRFGPDPLGSPVLSGPTGPRIRS
ncbi:MAG: DUF805 domain-containing protein [Pseudomonadota bacterium]|nr:DUF805 domain-containing protein [Pseudomonadota bacterium]